MDIFVIDKETYNPTMDIITDIEQVIWIERYNQPGEFKVSGPPIPLQQSLPLGAFISHPNTNEIMIVENHFIDETSGQSPKIVVSGRTLSTYIMSNRVVATGFYNGGMGFDSISQQGLSESYEPNLFLSSDYAWNHAFSLIMMFLVDSESGDFENLPNVAPIVVDFDGLADLNSQPRTIKRLSYLSDAVYDILQSADIGLKLERPSAERVNYGWLGEDVSTTLYFTIYKGADKSQQEMGNSVVFDWNSGDIQKARYFWSQQNNKNGLYAGTNDYTVRNHDQSKSGWDTRMLSVDCSDMIDPGVYPDPRAVLYSRGVDALLKNNTKGHFVDASASTTASPKYKNDYELGDIVNVIGNYSVNGPLRVIECAITADQTRQDVIPTLAPAYTNYDIDEVIEL